MPSTYTRKDGTVVRYKYSASKKEKRLTSSKLNRKIKEIEDKNKLIKISRYIDKLNKANCRVIAEGLSEAQSIKAEEGSSTEETKIADEATTDSGYPTEIAKGSWFYDSKERQFILKID